MVVGVGPIHHPPAVSAVRCARRSRSCDGIGEVSIFGADEMEFGAGGKSGFGAFIVTFEPGVAEALAERGDCADKRNGQDGAPFHGLRSQ